MCIQHPIVLSKVSKLGYSERGSGTTVVLISIQLIILLLIPIFIMGTHYLILENTKGQLVIATEAASYKVITDMTISSISRDRPFIKSDFTQVFEIYLFENLKPELQNQIESLTVEVEGEWLSVFYIYKITNPWPKDLVCHQKYKIPMGY